jgi:hypothetical protein
MAGLWRQAGKGALLRKEFPRVEQHAYSLLELGRMPEVEERETVYPHPFTPDFYELMPHFFDPGDQAAVKQQIYDRWLRERFVVFMAREHKPEEERTAAGMLDDLVVNSLMDSVVRRLDGGGAHMASGGGGIAILTFEQAREAMDFVRAAHDKFAENGMPVVAGVDWGPVLMFQTGVGPSGIAGDPINVASKLAEDVGRVGGISVTDRAARLMGSTEGYERFETQISGITLRGITLV